MMSLGWQYDVIGMAVWGHWDGSMRSLGWQYEVIGMAV